MRRILPKAAIVLLIRVADDRAKRAARLVEEVDLAGLGFATDDTEARIGDRDPIER